MPRVPKTKVISAIPQPFVQFMSEVATAIASGDDSTTIESDDLLQSDCAFGGLTDPSTRRFNFCYFHDDDVTWNIMLDASQIGAIANGSLSHVELWRCSNGKKCECLYATEDSYCPNCDSIRHFDAGYAESLRRWYPELPVADIDSLTNLRRIVHAILCYVDENGKMPPPFTTNENGDRLHSWRSLILPFLELNDLYSMIDFTQPWHAAVNVSVAAQTPGVFRIPSSPPSYTRYLAIVGSQTLWPLDAQRTLADVRSGLSNTIAIVEAPHSAFCWMDPHDIDIETLSIEVKTSQRPLLASWIDGNTAVLKDLDAKRIRDLAVI